MSKLNKLEQDIHTYDVKNELNTIIDGVNSNDEEQATIDISSKFTPASGISLFKAVKTGNVVQLSFVMKPTLGWNNAFSISDSNFFPSVYTAFSTNNNSGADGDIVLSGGVDVDGRPAMHSSKAASANFRVSVSYIIEGWVAYLRRFVNLITESLGGMVYA